MTIPTSPPSCSNGHGRLLSGTIQPSTARRSRRFKTPRNAKTNNLHQGVDLSTESDQSPQAARSTLEALLGTATVVVESGGEWINPVTGEIEPKVHLHWRLENRPPQRRSTNS